MTEIPDYPDPRAHRLREERRILRNLNRIIASSLISEVFEGISGELKKLIDFDRMSITVLTEQKDQFELVALAKDYGLTKFAPQRYPVKEGTVLKRIIDTGRPVFIKETEKSRFLPQAHSGLLKAGIQSGLSCPLKYKGEVIGAINFGSRKANNFSRKHLRLLRRITNQLAVAVENSRLFNKIREEQERYKKLFDYAKEAIFILEAQGGYIIEANHQAVNDLGYSQRELLGASLLELCSSLERATLIQVLQEVLEKETSHTFDSSFLRKDGTFIVFEMTLSVVEYGGKKAIQGIARDVTEKRKREQEKEVIGNISKIIASSLDIRSVYKAISIELNRILDFDRMDIALPDESGEKIELFALAKDYDFTVLREGGYLPREFTAIGVVLDTHKPIIVRDTEEGRFLEDDKLFAEGIRSYLDFPLEYKGYTIGALNFGSKKVNNFSEKQFDLLEQISNHLAVAIENTKLFNKIKEEGAKYERLFENASNPIFILDPSTGQILNINHQAELTFGYAMEELLEMNILKLSLKEEQASMINLIQEALQSGSSKTARSKLTRKDGTCCTVEIHVSESEYGGKRVIQLVMQDITEQEHLEQIRRDLTSMIVHDLKNPLGTLIGTLEVFLEERAGPVNGMQQQLLKTALNSSVNLLNMITDLLDIHKMEEGNLGVEREFVAFPQLIEAAVEQVKFFQQAKAITLKREGTENLPMIFVDPEKITRVLVNLLNNAVKYTPERGQVCITTSVNSAELIVRVQDSGPGIPSEYLDKIFDKFVQFEPRQAGRAASTGLGLAFCKLVIKAHKGKIWAESTPNQGSSFIFTLPFVSQ